MNIPQLLRRVEKFTSDHSPLILTGLGTAGVITTAVLAAKGGMKAHRILLEEQRRISLEKTGEPDNRFAVDFERAVKLTWTCYLPAAGSVLLTCGAIIGANQIGTRRQAALAAAYGISEKAFEEYREKVKEKFGESKEQTARDELNSERVARMPAESSEVVIIGDGEQLCCDLYSGRFFKSDMETLKKAQNDLNYRMFGDDYASLADYYHLIGLPATSGSHDMGWNIDKPLEIHYTTCLDPKGRPAIAIDFQVVPIRDYFRRERR